MTMIEIQNAMRELGGQIRATAARLSQDAASSTVAMTEIENQQQALQQMNQRMAALKASYDAQYAEQAGALNMGGAPAGEPAQDRQLSTIRASREYARAFAAAVRQGITPQRGMGNEQLRPLYDALTIGGGDPAGKDGGFLVPEDIDLAIQEQRRYLAPLADLFGQEEVNSQSGWRIMDTAPDKGMTALTSEIPAGGIAMDDQPAFQKVPFQLTTYALIVPLSNELAADEDAGLFAYLSRWFAKKQVITENLLLKAVLEKLTASAIAKTDDAVAALKTLLNKALDPAISLGATILTNQDGFDYLDQLKATDGRPVLQPDPTNATVHRFAGRRVVVASNKMLPTRVASGNHLPIYVGDFAQYATLFTKRGLEVRSTDIGGNAFRSNAIEVRGVARMGTAIFDKDAAVRREIAAGT